MDTFRRVYGELTEAQKAEADAIKAKAEELEALLIAANPRNPRLIAVAKTQLELCIMCAVKAVTTTEVVATPAGVPAV